MSSRRGALPQAGIGYANSIIAANKTIIAYAKRAGDR